MSADHSAEEIERAAKAGYSRMAAIICSRRDLAPISPQFTFTWEDQPEQLREDWREAARVMLDGESDGWSEEVEEWVYLRRDGTLSMVFHLAPPQVPAFIKFAEASGCQPSRRICGYSQVGENTASPENTVSASNS